MESKCIDPGAVQDGELDACLDGEAPSHVVEHLERCPACRARLAQNVAFEHRLRQHLYRCTCPTPDQLRDYHWGYLSADARRQVEAHLETCPHCQVELADLAEFVAAERTQPVHALLVRARQLAAQVRLVVASLVSPTPGLVPALRGETREVLLFEAGEIALSVNLEQEESGAYTLFGQILSPLPLEPPVESAAVVSYARLTAREERPAPVQSPLDANGGFAFPGLAPGVYQLIIHLPKQRIVVPGLALKTEA